MLGFTQLNSDQCVYLKTLQVTIWTTGVHIDDMALIMSSTDATAQLVTELQKFFQLSTLGNI